MTDSPNHDFTRGLYDWITHTELASTAPSATQAWAVEVLGWEFQPPFPTPSGDYRLFAYAEQGGGGIRATAPGEAPGATPTVHVEDTNASYAAAIAAGAESVAAPETIMPGVRVAMVRAPGGVLFGLSGPPSLLVDLFVSVRSQHAGPDAVGRFPKSALDTGVPGCRALASRDHAVV